MVELLNIMIAEADLDRVLDEFAIANNYNPEPGGQPNPESKAAFFKRKMIDYIGQITVNYELDLSRKVFFSNRPMPEAPAME